MALWAGRTEVALGPGELATARSDGQADEILRRKRERESFSHEFGKPERVVTSNKINRRRSFSLEPRRESDDGESSRGTGTRLRCRPVESPPGFTNK